MPRNYVRKTNGPRYSKQDLLNAVNVVQNRNKTYRQAQDAYNVPIAVISQRLNERKPSLESTGRGRQTVFSAQMETKIVECLLARARAGYPCDKEEYVKKSNLKTPFIDERPGEDWYYMFLKRHKNVLSLKKPEHLQKCRVEARKPDVIYQFYEDLSDTLTQMCLAY